MDRHERMSEPIVMENADHVFTTQQAEGGTKLHGMNWRWREHGSCLEAGLAEIRIAKGGIGKSLVSARKVRNDEAARAQNLTDDGATQFHGRRQWLITGADR